MTGVELKFLTINAQKAGANNPSLANIATMLDQHSPDILLLTETPLPPHSGALLHVLRNRGYRIHHHPPNAPFQPDGLPEARVHGHVTHPGGGCWLAYMKHTSWTTLVSPITLPHNCPIATICAVELTLFNGTKAAIVSCYPHQTIEAHFDTYAALTKLPNTLPHSLIIWMGGPTGGLGPIVLEGRTHSHPPI